MKYDDLIGRKITQCEDDLYAYAKENGYTVSIMEKADQNIDVDLNRLCVVIDNNGVIVNMGVS